MDVVTGVELECSYGAGDGRTRSGVASMPKERSGGPRLDRSCNWEKYGYDIARHNAYPFSHGVSLLLLLLLLLRISLEGQTFFLSLCNWHRLL